MKPESARFIDHANIVLARAEIMSRSYEFKSVADYFSGPDPVTSPEEAAEAIETAKRFVAHFAALVPVPGADPDGGP
jgi:hypothetical protein